MIDFHFWLNFTFKEISFAIFLCYRWGHIILCGHYLSPFDSVTWGHAVLQTVCLCVYTFLTENSRLLSFFQPSPFICSGCFLVSQVIKLKICFSKLYSLSCTSAFTKVPLTKLVSFSRIHLVTLSGVLYGWIQSSCWFEAHWLWNAIKTGSHCWARSHCVSVTVRVNPCCFSSSTTGTWFKEMKGLWVKPGVKPGSNNLKWCSSVFELEKKQNIGSLFITPFCFLCASVQLESVPFLFHLVNSTYHTDI